MKASVFLLALSLGACGAAEAPANGVLAAGNVAAPASGFPALTGRVVDNASLLSVADEARLSGDLAALEQRTSDQLVIVTVPSLDGQTIEAFATALGNHWRIGQRDKDNGVLLVVAPNERKVRIAVGYGLEAILTDSRAQEIIDRHLLPAFRNSEFTAGISAAIREVAAILVSAENQPRRRQG